MPLILKTERAGATLLLWAVSESEEELRAPVTEADRASAVRFGAACRRVEHLAWRAALRTVLPDATVAYSSCGAPYLVDSPLHISVAHTGGLAAVIVSERPCAVDVERADRDFGATCARFVSAAEEALPDAVRADFAAAVWCAKEAMYKLSGRSGLDFLRDLAIVASDLAGGKIYGRIAGGATIEMDLFRTEGYLIIYT